ncbi:hypothetical protein BDN72DRAFT_738953, partial [Pluteus cervinus]
LAYVEIYTPFLASPDPDHGLYRIKPELHNGSPIARVVPINNICRSVHLFPKFGSIVSPTWTSSNV